MCGVDNVIKKSRIAHLKEEKGGWMDTTYCTVYNVHIGYRLGHCIVSTNNVFELNNKIINTVICSLYM